MIKERDYLWDNIKAFLILTVVIGHIFASFTITSEVGENIRYWIYTFHMPAFVFVSGFWAKKYCQNGNVKGEKVAVFASYYVIFQVLLFFFCKYAADKSSAFTLFTPNVGLWYLLAMVVYYLLIPMFEKMPVYIAMPFIVLMGLFIGMESQAGTFFTISRIFVFAPFFFAGYYVSGDLITQLKKNDLRFIYGSVAIILSIVMWYNNKFLTLKSTLFYGKADYKEMAVSFKSGVFQRFYAYIIAALMIFAIIAIMPKCKTFFSYVGRNSLQIYILHLFPVAYFFSKREELSFIQIKSGIDVLFVILIGTAVTFILSINIFGYPFKWIQNGVLMVYDKFGQKTISDNEQNEQNKKIYIPKNKSKNKHKKHK